MRSALAILLFLVASGLVIFSQARAEVSCGTCGGEQEQEKKCGLLRKDLKYTYDKSSQEDVKSRVEMCLDLEVGGVVCGVTSDPLLQSAVMTMIGLQVEEVCFKFDTSQSPRKIISAQSKLF